MDLAYDGAAFHGWAAQTGLRTVQGELESWITRILRLETPATLTVAGRTDAGVHARGQVAHLDLPDPTALPQPTALPDPIAPGEAALAAQLGHRLGRVLPADLVVRRVTVAPDGFDARFSALWRRYVFRLADAGVDPLHRGMVVRVDRPLDADAMARAAAALVGLHDFAAFCKRREGATTIRDVHTCAVRRESTGEFAGTVRVELRADAFCHSMVRSVVGALVAVGTGRRDAAWLAALVDAPHRAGDVTVLPPHGLVLEEVGYPPDDQLAARQLAARARRDRPEENP
nr:tRNA pseudouridine(38-40) synthase TruA [Propioniciclava soli]